MSWFRATIFTLFVGACGFTPVYGPGGGQDLVGTILAAEPETQTDFAFVRALEDRLGTPRNPLFSLAYVISIDEEGRAITGSNDITRFTVDGSLAYTVKIIGGPDAETLTRGTVQSFTSYSASGSSIATFQAKRDAEERLMQILAERLAERLLGLPELR